MTQAAHNCIHEQAATAVGRFNQQAAKYRHYASIQRDMAAWLAQWLTPQAAPARDANAQERGAQIGDASATDAATESSPVTGEQTGGPSATGEQITNAQAAATGERNQCADSTHVLDLGAGDGTFTQYLAERFTNVSAIDSAEQMLRQGRERLPEVQWLHGDAWTPEPLCDYISRAKLITSASLLQWCSSPQRILQDWAIHCTSGTRMLHGFYVEPTLAQWRSLFGNTGSLDWLAPQQWQHAFTHAGWRILRSECEVRQYSFANALELARSLHGTGAIANAGQLSSGRFRALLRQYDATFRTASLPADQKLYRFSETVTDEKSNGGVFASWAFFRIEAERC